jgi:hypothetical protein
MGIFGPPDIEELRRKRDWPRLIHWSLYDRDPESARAARAVLRDSPYPLVEYLYETALWAQQHSIGRKRRLPKHSVMLLNEASRAFVRAGEPFVQPLVDALLLYDQYGDPEEDAKVLMVVLATDILEHIGRPAEGGLRQLAKARDPVVAKHARTSLRTLTDRGVFDDEDDADDDE